MSSSFGTESEFKFEELFFSRTNTRGIIQSANSVFQRVSKYEWEELLQKPHKIIRHPAMPRGVFQLFWDELLSNNQIGSYVVNKAKDGSYYWVFALAFPIENGFLSVRLKPSSSVFEVIKKKYDELLGIEKSRGVSPTESKTLLLEEINKLNFRDYKQFMTEALAQEVEARQKVLGKEPIQILSQLLDVSLLGNKLQKECQSIFDAYSKAVLVPLNLEVQAARIGEEAAPLAVISSQYDSIAKQINSDIKNLLNAVNTVEELSSNSCKFDVCSFLLLQEVISFFNEEADTNSSIDKDLEMSLLQKASQKNLSESISSLTTLENEFKKFRATYVEVKKQATALEIISISGKVEAVKIRQSSELMSLLDELNNFKNTLKECLKNIDSTGNTLIGQIQQIKSKLGQ